MDAARGEQKKANPQFQNSRKLLSFLSTTFGSVSRRARVFSFRGFLVFFFSWIGTYILHFIGCHIINLPTAQKDARQKAFRALGSVWSPLLPLALGSFFLLIFFFCSYILNVSATTLLAVAFAWPFERETDPFFFPVSAWPPRGHRDQATAPVQHISSLYLCVCVCEFVPFGVFAWTVVDDGIYGRWTMLKTIRECCRVQAQEGHTTFGTCWHGTWVCGALVTSWDGGNKRASLGLDILWGMGFHALHPEGNRGRWINEI